MRLNWLQDHEHYQLRKHKGRWSCARLGTNYAYPTFHTVREAIDWARKEEGDL